MNSRFRSRPEYMRVASLGKLVRDVIALGLVEVRHHDGEASTWIVDIPQRLGFVVGQTLEPGSAITRGQTLILRLERSGASGAGSRSAP